MCAAWRFFMPLIPAALLVRCSWRANRCSVEKLMPVAFIITAFSTSGNQRRIQSSCCGVSTHAKTCCVPCAPVLVVNGRSTICMVSGSGNGSMRFIALAVLCIGCCILVARCNPPRMALPCVWCRFPRGRCVRLRLFVRQYTCRCIVLCVLWLRPLRWR